MFQILKGDIFDQSPDAFVNPIASSLTMGGGLDREFRAMFPGLTLHHLKSSNGGWVEQGRLSVYRESESGPLVIGLPIRVHWREPVVLSDVEEALQTLREYLEAHPEIRSVAIPALGCGSGGLAWVDVQEAIFRRLKAMNRRFMVFYPLSEE